MKKFYTSPEIEAQLLEVADVIAVSVAGSDPAKDDTIDDYYNKNDPGRNDSIEIV